MVTVELLLQFRKGTNLTKNKRAQMRVKEKPQKMIIQSSSNNKSLKNIF